MVINMNVYLQDLLLFFCVCVWVFYISLYKVRYIPWLHALLSLDLSLCSWQRLIMNRVCVCVDYSCRPQDYRYRGVRGDRHTERTWIRRLCPPRSQILLHHGHTWATLLTLLSLSRKLKLNHISLFAIFLHAHHCFYVYCYLIYHFWSHKPTFWVIKASETCATTQEDLFSQRSS